MIMIIIVEIGHHIRTLGAVMPSIGLALSPCDHSDQGLWVAMDRAQSLPEPSFFFPLSAAVLSDRDIRRKSPEWHMMEKVS